MHLFDFLCKARLCHQLEYKTLKKKVTFSHYNKTLILIVRKVAAECVTKAEERSFTHVQSPSVSMTLHFHFMFADLRAA